MFMLETTSPILEIPDVNSYNLYFGWYSKEFLEQNDEFFDNTMPISRPLHRLFRAWRRRQPPVPEQPPGKRHHN